MGPRPNVIRADTLDLQDHDAPSAKDHSNQPSHPSPLGEGRPAPHQEASLRHVAEERSAERESLEALGSARSSHELDQVGERPTQIGDDAYELRGTRLDEAAIQLNGGIGTDMDGDTLVDGIDGMDPEPDDRIDDELLDDRVSSSPSIEGEDDIDWNSVYALHAFVATVEGQANATKGEPMTLLDDTNSYWWLVRLIKDGSIGYLPAEHIETPMERLARFNKHKNVELSSAHLTDTTPLDDKKSKTSKLGLPSREKKRKVQFSRLTPQTSTAPTWSDDEGESGDEAEANNMGEHNQINGSEPHDHSMSDADRVHPSGETDDAMAIDTHMQNNGDGRISPSLDPNGQVNGEPGSPERTPSVSKNGTIRNTDSFFKDNTAEPRKISLTPKIARDDAESDYRQSGDSPDRPADIFDQIERQNSLSEMQKDEKRKREKKPSMLSGLFKRKERKIKVDEAAGGTVVRQEGDNAPARDTPEPPRSSKSNSSAQDSVTNKRTGSGKLSKAPPQNMVNGSLKAPNKKRDEKGTDSPSYDASPNSEISASPTSATMNTSFPADSGNSTITPVRNASTEQDSTIPPYSSDPDTSGQPNGLQNHNYARPQVDRFVTASETPYQQADSLRSAEDHPAPISPVDGMMDGPNHHVFKSDDTALHDSPIDEQNHFINSSNNAVINGPQQNGVYKSTMTNLMTPDTWSHPVSQHIPNELSPATSANGLSWQQQPSESEWDDAALSKYINERSHSDTKDLLHLVNDTTGVPPLPPDHPTMLQFGFHEHQKKLDDMSSELDSMLMDFMARKSAKSKVRTR